MTHPLFSYHAVKHLTKPRLGKAEALFCQEDLLSFIGVRKKHIDVWGKSQRLH